jgi:hypothetical protein
MRYTTSIILSMFLGGLGCAALDDDDSLELRGGKLDDVTECSDDDVVQVGSETKAYAVKSTTEIVLADGVDYEIDPKNGVVYLDDGVTGFQCRCASGCSEAQACEAGGSDRVLTCSGQCSGISDDGQSCGGCQLHTVEVPSPGGGAPGQLDPSEGGPSKPPGTDPPPGEFDPGA